MTNHKPEKRYKATAIIYCREATKESAESQQKRIAGWLDQAGVEVKAVFVDTIPERTDPQKIREYCKKHKVEFVASPYYGDADEIMAEYHRQMED
ncbi:SCO family protein [Candidatus Saccharibacteria bacterium]|nr:SCO family protein [Candidatus Saccharibacteria bacterium]